MHSNQTDMQEVIFEIREDEIDGGFVATCLGHSIVTQAESVEELREMIKDAVHCHFGDGAAGQMPGLIRLHFVRDEVLIA
jgi:predicted RNase H-like HicB family nuclease